MTYSINDSIETSQNGFNSNNINSNISFQQSTEIMNDRDYRKDRKLLQFNRLSRTLQELESEVSELNLEKKKCNRKQLIHKKKESKVYKKNKEQYLNTKMDNCHRAENSIKFDKDSFTYVSSALIQNRNSFNAVDESNHLNEVDRLKNEVLILKKDNNKLHATTDSLKQEVEELNKNIFKKAREDGKSNESFEKIDNTFIEMNKILSDLSHTKLLLQKTRQISSERNETLTTNIKAKSQVSFENNLEFSKPSIHVNMESRYENDCSKFDYYPKRSSSLNRNDKNIKNDQVNSYLISQEKNSPKRVEKRFQTNLRVNPLIDLNCKLDKLKSSLYPIDTNVNQETNDSPIKVSYTKNENEINTIIKSLEKFQMENFELKRKISDIEKCFIEKGKQSELWKTMYDRLVNCLPESKANLVKNSLQIEKQNIFDDQNNNDTLSHQIKKLNDDNLSLKMHLDNLKQENQKELDRINEYKLENEKLKQELDRLFKESEVDVQSRNELNQQIERFKIKLKQEQDEKEEMRNRYEIELNAAKIRYENELEKQNKLMNMKYDALFNETSQLNLLVNSLQREKSDLLGLIQREVSLRKEINEHKEAINKRVVNNQNFACKRHSYSSGSNIQFIQSFSATDLQSCDISVNFVGSLSNESPDSSVNSSQTYDQIEKNTV